MVYFVITIRSAVLNEKEDLILCTNLTYVHPTYNKIYICKVPYSHLLFGLPSGTLLDASPLKLYYMYICRILVRVESSVHFELQDFSTLKLSDNLHKS
jgi:hypothetical protein